MNELISKNITKYRRKQNLSKSELAELLKVDDHTVYCYETGRRTPGVAAQVRLAAALNIRREQLLEE